MKKLLCIILAITMCMSISACMEEPAEPQEISNLDTETNLPAEKQIPDGPIEYHIYSTNMGSAKDPEGEGLPIVNCGNKLYDDYTIDYKSANPGNVKAKFAKGDILTLYLPGQDEAIKVRITGANPVKPSLRDCADDAMKRDYIIFEYSAKFVDDEKNLFRMNVDSRDGKILSYSISYKNKPEGSFTREQAVEKAKEVLSYLYDEETLKEYTLSKRTTGLFVVFSRNIEGFECMGSDCIRFNFHSDGTLQSFYRLTFGYLDPVIDKLTAENLQNADRIFKASVNQDTEDIYSCEIVINNKDGKCYLAYTVNSKNLCFCMAGDCYINIY